MANRLLTGLTRQQEQAFQQRLFARVSNIIEPQLRRDIARTMRDMARSYDDTGRQAEILHRHRENVAGILNRAWTRMFRVSGERILKATQKSHQPSERKNEDDFLRRMREWISINGSLKVTRIVGTTQDQAADIINNALGVAVTDGMGQDATGKLIQATMRERGAMLSTQRARVIARTETHSASQASGMAAAESTGLRLEKEWIADRSDRTRDDHADADGQTVPMDQPFDVGGESLMYPGDPSGSAEQIINCRCTVGYVPVE